MNSTDGLFWPYFSDILEEQKDENGVVYTKMSDANGMQRMLEDGVSEDIYPGIFFFRPKVRLSRTDNHLVLSNFNVVFFVFVHGKLDDREIQDAAFAKAETIVTSIVQRLQLDERICVNFLDFNSVEFEPVSYLGSDAAYGYEVKMKIGLPSNQLFC